MKFELREGEKIKMLQQSTIKYHSLIEEKIERKKQIDDEIKLLHRKVERNLDVIFAIKDELKYIKENEKISKSDQR